MPVQKKVTEQQLASLFKDACMAELTALKPGNVHIFADGHGMVVQDFIKSAEVTAAVIAQPGLNVGQRILNAVNATWDAVACNTNLGIVLLSAPIIQAALQNDNAPLQTKLHSVLNSLTVEDAALSFQAIQRASPAGLGASDKHDVHAVPEVTLLAAMQEAAHRDTIARQYDNGYADILGFGLDRYRQALIKWDKQAWAVTALYLGFLANYDDSHVLRKFGAGTSSALRDEARLHEHALMQLGNPKLYQRQLMDWDASLKTRRLNPGTSADLTVATLLTHSLS